MRQPAETEGALGRGVLPHEPTDVERGVPRLPRAYVPRGTLWSRLDDATVGSNLTLLVAPAGSGKTLGVAGWLRERSRGVAERDVVWIKADRTWEAPRLRTVLEQAARVVDDRTEPAGTPSLVVIDDAHSLPASSVRLVDSYLNGDPDRLRVLLLSRWDLPLSRLVPQLLGQYTILRGDVLKLDDDESAALVRAHARTESAEVIDLVTAQGQGWCAAVVLLARAVGSSPDAVAAAHRFTERDARVADLVASEVFASLRPRERHLLLCIAHEGTISVRTASHLSHDAAAGEVLSDLEATGLLVTQVVDLDVGRGGDALDNAYLPVLSGAQDPDRVYAIHPLLAEVVRRRIVAGGVDVARAKSTVRRAVALDVARGETWDCFRRLVAIDEPFAAAERLAASGHALVIQGQGDEVRAFAARYPDTVQACPRTWFFLALERWVANDAQGALHWLDKVINEVPKNLRQEAPHEAQVVSARLMRARLGFESLDDAVADGQRFVAEHLARAPREAVPHLLIELGVTQVWLGHVRNAEANLSQALHLSQDLGMSALTASAMTHLASMFFIDGSEHLCRQMAARALSYIESRGDWQPLFAEHRARLFLELTAISDLPLPDVTAHSEEVPRHVHVSDLTVRFWQRLSDARTALIAGSVIEAERLLAVPLGVTAIPAHLQATMHLEHGWLAFFAEDRTALRKSTVLLDELGYPGEVSLLRGLYADLDGDQRGAATHFIHAADNALLAQPPYRAIALVCAAQLLDSVGLVDQARKHLHDALVATEARRNAVPFLGWVRHGTPVDQLLGSTEERRSGAWTDELRVAVLGFPGVTLLLSPMISTASERDAAQLLVAPSLSPRERDVLHALARGSTYRDIAAHLVLSENTVKTHVSSLYSKLGAGRRSEALREARKLNLI